MKKLIVIAGAGLFMTGCAFNAKDEVPGVQWDSATIDIGTNGITHCVITKYNSKKDIQLAVNPVTHAVTLGSVMNPSNTLAAGVASSQQINAQANAITATGTAATSLLNSINTAAGAGVVGALTGK